MALDRRVARPAAAAMAAVPYPRSMPALAHALRYGLPPQGEIRPTLVALNSVAQVYRVSGATPAAECAAAAHAVAHAAERLRRLPSAYGEWGHFDAAAYFDFSRAQSEILVRIVEGVTTVHVTLYADLLLPSFRRAVALWAQSRLLRRNGDLDPEHFEHLAGRMGDRLDDAWRRADLVLDNTRLRLLSDVAFLAASDVAGERWRWANAGSGGREHSGAFAGADPSTAPTLTLAVDFPLPAWRQPDRKRRLRRNRERRLRREQRASRAGGARRDTSD